jgi:murein tripeptide amidase MpaA
MQINSEFDGGNAKFINSDNNGKISLEIVPDENSKSFQWFCFDLAGAKGRACEIELINAGNASYSKGYENYSACASYDGENWFRVETEYDGSALHILHKPAHDLIRYSYFAPYDLTRHQKLIDRCQASSVAAVESLGHTVERRKIDCVILGGNREDNPACWFIGRQHPGETMAEWWLEGLLDALLDEKNEVAINLRQSVRIFVVPNMNPDGSYRGHIRGNALGQDLNRVWDDPSAEKTPEVFHVLAKMRQTGVVFSLDVHGDEALPYVFLTGGYGIPSMTEKQIELRQRYSDQLLVCSDEFQTDHGYPKARPGKANLSICANYLAETFGGVAFTLEQPFKDNALQPNAQEGWSPERARKMGGDSLHALLAIAADLKTLKQG